VLKFVLEQFAFGFRALQDSVSMADCIGKRRVGKL
jgi:hypothetical protein